MTWHLLGNIALTIIAANVVIVALLIAHYAGERHEAKRRAKSFDAHVDRALYVTRVKGDA